MPVNLSIKNVPDELVARLKERAKRNHRSLQGELMVILEGQDQSASLTDAKTLRDIHEWNRQMGYSSPSESAEIVRRMRDTR